MLSSSSPSFFSSSTVLYFVLFLSLFSFLPVLSASSVHSTCTYVKPHNFKPIECKHIVGDRPFFVPPRPSNVTKQSIIQTARQAAYSLSVIRTECRNAALEFVCLSTFRPCFITRFSPSLPNFLVLPLPSPPCRSICESFVSVCKKEMDEGIIPAVGCSNTSETGEPLFPKKRVLISLNNGALQVNVPCERVHNKSVVIDDPEECPPPTIHNHYHDEYPKCTPPCLIFFTETQRDGIVILGYVLTFINLTFDVILLIVLLKIQEFRKWPAHMIAMIVFINLIRTLVVVIVRLIEGDETVCKNRFETATTYDAGCGITGVIFGVIGYASAIYCCWIIWSITLVVSFNISLKTVSKLMIPSHVISWGIPIISFIVVLAKDKLSGSPLTLMTCAIDGNATGYFWGCLLIGLFVSIVLTLIASVFLLNTLFKNQEKRAQLLKNLSLFIFIGTYFLLIIVVCSVACYAYASLDDWRDSVKGQLQCSIQNRFVSKDEFNNCSRESSPNYGLMIYYTILSQGIGIWFSIAFMFHPKFRATLRKLWGFGASPQTVTRITGTSAKNGSTSAQSGSRSHSHSHSHSNPTTKSGDGEEEGGSSTSPDASIG